MRWRAGTACRRPGLLGLPGLDATAFNRSKRVSKDGRERWPSTESIAKILDATAESFDTFLSGGGAYLQMPPPLPRSAVPLLGLAQAGAGGFFDSAGFPVGQGWDEVHLPTGERRRHLCARGLRQFDAAALPRRRHHRGLPDRAAAARRPRSGAHQGRRGDGQGPPPADQQDVELHSLNPDHPARTLESAKSRAWAGSCGRASSQASASAHQKPFDRIRLLHQSWQTEGNSGGRDTCSADQFCRCALGSPAIGAWQRRSPAKPSLVRQTRIPRRLHAPVAYNARCSIAAVDLDGSRQVIEHTNNAS